MRYLLSDYAEANLQKIDDLVRLCYYNPLNGKWGFPWTQLIQIGTSLEGLEDKDVRYIKSNSSPVSPLNGVCFHKGDDFKIWLSPELIPGSLLFELTLIHELCHGYTGANTQHGQKWREFYGMAALMYAELINPAFTEANPEWQLKHTIRRYRNEEEDRYASFIAHRDASEVELEQVVARVESNTYRVTHDFNKLQELENSCRRSTSNMTPTPAYLALPPKKAGMALK